MQIAKPFLWYTYICSWVHTFCLFKLGLVCTVCLEKVISQSSTPVPKTSLLDGVWDFKAWIEPYLNNIKYHSKYICFWFTLNSSTGKGELHYKRFSDSPWEPEKEHLQILSVNVHVLCPSVLMYPSMHSCVHVIYKTWLWKSYAHS